MKSMLHMAMLSAFAAGVFGMEEQYFSDLAITEEEKEELREKRKLRIAELKRRGQSEFHIDGYTVFALNHKNALRKVKNLKSKEPKE